MHPGENTQQYYLHPGCTTLAICTLHILHYYSEKPTQCMSFILTVTYILQTKDAMSLNRCLQLPFGHYFFWRALAPSSLIPRFVALCNDGRGERGFGVNGRIIVAIFTRVQIDTPGKKSCTAFLIRDFLISVFLYQMK